MVRLNDAFYPPNTTRGHLMALAIEWLAGWSGHDADPLPAAEGERLAEYRKLLGTPVTPAGARLLSSRNPTQAVRGTETRGLWHPATGELTAEMTAALWVTLVLGLLGTVTGLWSVIRDSPLTDSQRRRNNAEADSFVSNAEEGLITKLQEQAKRIEDRVRVPEISESIWKAGTTVLSKQVFRLNAIPAWHPPSPEVDHAKGS